MANLSKKWGAVIGCWAVALALIVTGICLGLVIPSSAAEDTYEGDIAVTFDGETTVYHTMQAAVDAVNALPTAVDKAATIQLQSDVTVAGNDESFGVVLCNKHVIFDLNGHYLRSGLNNGAIYFSASNYDDSIGGAVPTEQGTTLTFIDSNPTATHYCSYRDGVYEFTDYQQIGEANTEVKGGVIAAWGLQFYAEYSAINFQAGTYVGKKGGLQITGYYDEESDITYTGKAVIEDGVTWQVSMSDDGTAGGMSLAMWLTGDSILEINGGSIYGEIAYTDMATGAATIVDLTNPQVDAVKVNANMKPIEIDGVKVYTVVDAEDKPTTTPTDPIVEQPKNNNNNMIGIIVLGAATVVMLAGVGAAIGIAVKRRKVKAA